MHVHVEHCHQETTTHPVELEPQLFLVIEGSQIDPDTALGQEAVDSLNVVDQIVARVDEEARDDAVELSICRALSA